MVWCGRRNGFCTFSKVSQMKRMRQAQDVFPCGRRSTKDISSRHVQRSGGFLRGFADMILRDRALRMTWSHFFVAGAVLSRHGKKTQNAFGYEAVSSALNRPFLRDEVAKSKK